jgi:hypothetical protein
MSAIHRTSTQTYTPPSAADSNTRFKWTVIAILVTAAAAVALTYAKYGAVAALGVGATLAAIGAGVTILPAVLVGCMFLDIMGRR